MINYGNLNPYSKIVHRWRRWKRKLMSRDNAESHVETNGHEGVIDCWIWRVGIEKKGGHVELLRDKDNWHHSSLLLVKVHYTTSPSDPRSLFVGGQPPTNDHVVNSLVPNKLSAVQVVVQQVLSCVHQVCFVDCTCCTTSSSVISHQWAYCATCCTT